jgi:putative spermidine/putrescine transport system ATP-binding protein
MRKAYGEVVAVDGLDLALARASSSRCSGPSGSGKTTTLRMIAGFEEPTRHGRAGRPRRDRRPPYDREVNTVFQDYALFPHMTVGENVAYGCGSAGRQGRAAQARRRGPGDGPAGRLRGPQAGELSGGQRQRVALARRSSTGRGCCCWTSRSARST